VTEFDFEINNDNKIFALNNKPPMEIKEII
jgi:hypothetical protein